MPRGKAKSNPDSAPSDQENGSKTPSKMAAVRLALGTLGYEAKPPALDDHIRKTWGLEIPHNMISSYKSQLKGKLKKGDLLFFGWARGSDTPEWITHVAIYLGKKSFIQSAERVKISSLDPAAPDYDEHHARHLLYARRILP